MGPPKFYDTGIVVSWSSSTSAGTLRVKISVPVPVRSSHSVLQNSPHTSSDPGSTLADRTVVEDFGESDSDVLSTSRSCSRTPPLELDRNHALDGDKVSIK